MPPGLSPFTAATSAALAFWLLAVAACVAALPSVGWGAAAAVVAVAAVGSEVVDVDVLACAVAAALDAEPLAVVGDGTAPLAAMPRSIVAAAPPLPA